MCLTEWSVPPEHINKQWSPELLWLMIRERKRNLDRMERDRQRAMGKETDDDMGPRNIVSDSDLLAAMNKTGKKRATKAYVNMRVRT